MCEGMTFTNRTVPTIVLRLDTGKCNERTLSFSGVLQGVDSSVTCENAFDWRCGRGYHVQMDSPVSNSCCVILVPANYGIDPECELGLTQLERRGYAVWRIPGFAAIDQCRNQAATDAIAHGFAELFWIDADIAFDPDAVDRLRVHD